VQTNLLIILAVVVLLAQAAAVILSVRYLARKWCTDVYKAGFRGGRQCAIESSDPFKQAYELGHDIGYERGAQSALTDQALADLSLAELERLTTRLFRATAARYDALNEGTGAECEADR